MTDTQKNESITLRILRTFPDRIEELESFVAKRIHQADFRSKNCSDYYNPLKTLELNKRILEQAKKIYSSRT